jgi:hypothetical protein
VRGKAESGHDGPPLPAFCRTSVCSYASPPFRAGAPMSRLTSGMASVEAQLVGRLRDKLTDVNTVLRADSMSTLLACRPARRSARAGRGGGQNGDGLVAWLSTRTRTDMSGLGTGSLHHRRHLQFLQAGMSRPGPPQLRAEELSSLVTLEGEFSAPSLVPRSARRALSRQARDSCRATGDGRRPREAPPQSQQQRPRIPATVPRPPRPAGRAKSPR